MRNLLICAALAIVALPAFAGAAVVVKPVGGIESNPSPDTYELTFDRAKLRPQEEWVFAIPSEFSTHDTLTVTLDAKFKSPDQQARVWLKCYPDAQGQTVVTDWQIMYAPELFFQATLPLIPTQVDVHVKNRADEKMVLKDIVYTAVSNPEPATLGTLAVAVVALVVRRRR